MDWLDDVIARLFAKRSSLDQSLLLYLLIGIFGIVCATLITVSICVSWERLILMPEEEPTFFWNYLTWAPPSTSLPTIKLLEMVRQSAVFVYSFLGIFFATKMFYRKRILQPITILEKSIQQIEQGNYQQPVYYNTYDEFEKTSLGLEHLRLTLQTNEKKLKEMYRDQKKVNAAFSHDLRTPLTSIQGYIKGVLDGVADTKERQEKYLKTAYDSTREMNVLLQKLFEFSRIESGQMPFHMVRADLAEFTSVYIAQKEEMADPENVTFSLKVGQDAMPELNMDVEQIPRIFDNLLENSMKYAGTRPVEIEISVFATETEVVLEWNDHGNGVSEDKLPHIFERFYRCDEARKEKGSGVGLYVVNYIMEQHHGRVEAENDGGLKIRLLFPKED